MKIVRIMIYDYQKTQKNKNMAYALAYVIFFVYFCTLIWRQTRV